MRLWHYELIFYLPNSQLLAQWRELNSIYKKQDKHILINYIYEYQREDLYSYSVKVVKEMYKRGFKINQKSIDNFRNYFKGYNVTETITPFENHHNNRYLLQCFYNLQEKYDRGQKDFSPEQYEKLENFIRFYLRRQI